MEGQAAPARSVRRPSRLATVLAVYGVAAGLGYLLGIKGAPLFSPPPPSPSLSSTRVGRVLSHPDPLGPPEAWEALKADVATVRESWPPSIRRVFELVVAARGLQTDGRADWAEAQQLCRALKWSRCDQAALEELRARSRP